MRHWWEDLARDKLIGCRVVTKGGAMVHVASNRSGVDDLLRHALGARAAIVVASTTPARAKSWTILALAAADYEARLTELVARLPYGVERALANYWRGDFAARRIGEQGGVAAVHHSAPFEGVTVFDAEAKSIAYLFPQGSSIFLPHLEHLVGHVLRFDGWSRGFVDLHAAFVRYRKKGVALIGPRQAGKTSLAMHLLGRGGELLGSDMAQIRVGAAGEIEAIGIPHMCRITRETVWDNRRLEAAIGAFYDDNVDYLRGPLFSHGKYELYDPALDRVFARKVGISEMKVDALLFPRFDVHLPRHEISFTGRSEAVRRLLESIKIDRPLADWLPFDLSAREQAETRLERQLKAGDAAVQAYDFAFGREPSLERESVDVLFDRM